MEISREAHVESEAMEANTEAMEERNLCKLLSMPNGADGSDVPDRVPPCCLGSIACDVHGTAYVPICV